MSGQRGGANAWAWATVGIWCVVIGAYAHARWPWAIAHVEYTDSAASPSAGPPRSAINPKKTAVATIHPITQEVVDRGASNHDVRAAVRTESVLTSEGIIRALDSGLWGFIKSQPFGELTSMKPRRDPLSVHSERSVAIVARQEEEEQRPMPPQSAPEGTGRAPSGSNTSTDGCPSGVDRRQT